MGAEDPPAHIEDDDEEDSMLEDMPETEDSDSDYIGDNEEEDAMLEDIEPQDEEPESQQPELPRRSQRLINATTGETHGDYWGHGQSFVLSVISQYGNLDATLQSTPQYGFQKGMKEFRDEGYDATIKELDENLIGKNVIDMLRPECVTWDIFQMSLAYLMFLKRKRNGLVKARGCADGRPQREYITKLESSAPTVKTHALFLNCLIDAVEERCVVVADIPGAFLQADWPDDAPDYYLRFEGVMIDMICQINPGYKDKIKYTNKRDRDGNRKRYLVGKVNKGVYGTLLGAILFYNKLKGVLEGLGFVVNDYDECTFNKMVNGVQCTVQFHVDDLRLSCVHQSVLDDMIDELNKEFGKDGPKLSASYGKIHEYLGMTIDWSIDGNVRFTMYDYLEDILQEAPPEFDGEDTTPATSDLFKVPETTLLSDEMADQFHRTAARFYMQAKGQDLTFKLQSPFYVKEYRNQMFQTGRN